MCILNRVAIPQGVRTFLEGFAGDATLQMLEDVTQFDFYNNPKDVTRAADTVAAHFAPVRTGVTGTECVALSPMRSHLITPACGGGKPETSFADDVIAHWADILPGFEVTHHMVTNETIVSIEGDLATAQADFTATHRIGQDFWVLGGQYDYTLIRDTEGWKVSGLTMTALWEIGSRDLVALAAQRASGGN